MAQLTSVSINTFNTGKVSDEKVIQLVREHSDLCPYTITKMLDLLRPMCQPTAVCSHFGCHPFELTVDGDILTTFTREKIDRTALPRDAVGL